MALYINGMKTQETAWLTDAMVHSGHVMSWPKGWARLVVDKHSTGGVGDKTSLPLAPALAVLGLKVCSTYKMYKSKCCNSDAYCLLCSVFLRKVHSFKAS